VNEEDFREKRRKMIVETYMDCCEAAEGIKENFGLEKALKYLLGEKFYKFLKLLRDTISDIDELEDPERKHEVPKEEKLEELKKDLSVFMDAKEDFVANIKEIFEPYELGEYLDSMPRFGAAEQFLSEEGYKEWRRNGVLEKDVVVEAEESLILGDMKELLL
jgi:hypothetical protein